MKQPKPDVRELTAEEYLDLSRKEVASAVTRIMKSFDFDKAARALRGCRWRYVGARRSPTVKELRRIAVGLLRSTIQSGWGSKSHQGPLAVECSHWGDKAVITATLSLVPVWKSEVYIDARFLAVRKGRKFAIKPQRTDPAKL